MTKFATAYVDVDANLAPMRKRLSGIGKLAAGAGAAVAGGIALELKRSVKAFTETEKVGSQTNAVLKSTGRAAGLSAKQIGTLATAISKKSGIDDEAVQSAENLLLTFTNVRNEAGKGNQVFSRATSIIADMSVALGQDMKSSSIQVGKALNDPIKGVTALQRVGVSFTKDQKEQIKTLVDSGKTMDAQKLILRELNKEFAGSAEAQAQPLDKLKVSLGNIEESIGSGFKPAIDSVATDLTHLADKVLPTVQTAADDVARVFGRTDLSVGEKINRSVEEAKVDLAPLSTRLAAEIKSQHFGQRVEDAVEFLTPRIAEGFAHAAPRAVGAFVRGWSNMDVGGQLIAALYLSKKLGIFTLFGRAAGTKMVGGMAESSTAASALGTRWGGLMATALKGLGWAAVGAYIIEKLGIGDWLVDKLGDPIARLLGFDRYKGDATAGGEHIPTAREMDAAARRRERRRRRRELELQNPVGPVGTAPLVTRPEHHRRRRRHPARPVGNGPAVAVASSFNGDATYSRMLADAATMATDATARIASSAPRRQRLVLPRRIARKFIDDQAMAPTFDDAFVDRTGLRRAIRAGRFSKHPSYMWAAHPNYGITGGFHAPDHRRHHRRRRRWPHTADTGPGGVAAPVYDQRSTTIQITTTDGGLPDGRLVGAQIMRELDRLG